MENSGMIYELIGQAIGKIGAIGKDKKNAQQGFMYRGIDQVYNALNPVMAELGIFFCPEILEMKREERVTKNGAVLNYTLLTMKYTAYAPDGSSVSMTVIGEGMDSGDKSSNKAMSVAMKYAMFQLFCIPTEEMKDPDADVYDNILPRGRQPQQPANIGVGNSVPPTAQNTAQKPPLSQRVEQTLNPQQPATPAPPAPETPGKYVLRMINQYQQQYGEDFNFLQVRGQLIAEGKVKDIPSAKMTMDDANALVEAMQQAMETKKAS